jgi:hypothetical protein
MMKQQHRSMRAFRGIVISAALFQVSCATGRHLDADMQDAKYHSGDGTPIIPRDRLYEPGVAVGIAGLASVFSKDYYESSKIGGECKIKYKDSAFGQPCRNVEVLFFSLDGNDVYKRTVQSDGTFDVAVKSGKKYRLVVPSSDRYEKFEVSNLERGHQIIIELKSKK